MKKYALMLCLFSLIACSTAKKDEMANQPVQPNVLLLIGDDISFADLGMYGSEIQTPNMDKLSEAGIRFSNFHASPVCSVTRSMLITGANNIEAGLATFDYSIYPPTEGHPGYEGYLTKNTVAISELFNDAGYNVYKSGKWHLGGEARGGEGPLGWGFTKEFGILSGGSNHWNNLAMTPDFADPDFMNKRRVEDWTLNGEPFDRPSGVYSGEIYTNYMLDFIKEGEEDGKPWFSWMAFTTAHFPVQGRPELVEKYYEQYLELGFDGLKEQRYKSLKVHGLISEQAEQAPENPLTLNWDDLSEDDKKYQARVMANYAAMIEDQDQRIGEIIAYLKESNQLDNTLIIYLTDNGAEGLEPTNPKTGNAVYQQWIEKNFSTELDSIGTANSINTIGTSWANATTGDLRFWKWFTGEGGIRVPMMILPPGALTEGYDKAGQISKAVVSVKDLPMTILDYAGLDHPGTEYKGRQVVEPSGISMRPFLEGETDIVRTEDQWYAFELFGNCYVMSGNYKASKVREGMFGDGKWHLYNVVDDPSESKPLEEQMPEKFEALKNTYFEYAKKHNIMDVDEMWSPFAAASDANKR